MQKNCQGSCGDGRLGRPSEGEAKRPEHGPALNCSADDNPLPVSPSRQCCSRLRSPPLPSELGRRLRSRRPRAKQSIQRGARTRQRRVLRACAQKRALAITQLGIFRKDDLFEVVLDPGPDKLEKVILGPAPSKRSTGERFTQPHRQPATKLNHSIGQAGTRQFRRVGNWLCGCRVFWFWACSCGDSRPRLSGRAQLGWLLI